MAGDRWLSSLCPALGQTLRYPWGPELGYGWSLLNGVNPTCFPEWLPPSALCWTSSLAQALPPSYSNPELIFVRVVDFIKVWWQQIFFFNYKWLKIIQNILGHNNPIFTRPALQSSPPIAVFHLCLATCSPNSLPAAISGLVVFVSFFCAEHVSPSPFRLLSRCLSLPQSGPSQ